MGYHANASLVPVVWYRYIVLTKRTRRIEPGGLLCSDPYFGPFLTVVEEDPALTRVELVDGGGNTGGEGGGGEAFAFLEAL